MTSHRDLAALAEGYVLGTLEESEAQAFAAHLAECEDCRRDARELSAVAEGLGKAAPQVAPPAALRARVLQAATAAVRQQATVDRPRFGGAPPAAAPAVTTPPSTSRWGWLALAASLVAIVLAWTTWQSRQDAALARADRENAERRVASLEAQVQSLQGTVKTATHTRAVLAASDLTRVDLAGQAPSPGASGRVFWSPQHGLVFAATNLPPLPAGRVYQLWIVAEAPISAGILSDGPASGAGTVNSPPVSATPKAFAVTIEPEGGRPAPTGPMLLLGALN